MKKLQQPCREYQEQVSLNYEVLREFLDKKGQKVELSSGTIIVSGGDFPDMIYFITQGTAIGKRFYEDGSEYTYFEVDSSNGNLGLLEVLARKNTYISTVTCSSPVIAVKVEAHLVYQEIMNNPSLLRRCSVLLAQDLYQSSGREGILYRFQGIDRVRYYLVQYYELNGTNFIPRYQEIAFKLGTSIRTIGRSMQKLKANHELSNQERKMFVNEENYQLLKKRLNAK